MRCGWELWYWRTCRGGCRLDRAVCRCLAYTVCLSVPLGLGGGDVLGAFVVVVVVFPGDCLGELFIGTRRVGFGFPARFQGCRRGARDLQLLTGPGANDNTSI